MTSSILSGTTGFFGGRLLPARSQPTRPVPFTRWPARSRQSLHHVRGRSESAVGEIIDCVSKLPGGFLSEYLRSAERFIRHVAPARFILLSGS